MDTLSGKKDTQVHEETPDRDLGPGQAPVSDIRKGAWSYRTDSRRVVRVVGGAETEGPETSGSYDDKKSVRHLILEE